VRIIRGSKWASLTVLALCQVAVMALWFSASAVVPALLESYPLSGFAQSLFTSAVQVGFVVGSLVSALLGLSDRLPPKGFFMASALLAALANALILTVPPDSAWVALFRFVTGLCMAGIYPVGMKLAATWARGDMGLMVGLPLTAASVSALCAGLAINLMGVGPVFGSAPRFRARFVLWAWKIRTIRLANFGYLGHMWELYAMWAWIGVFLQASFAERLAPDTALLSARLMTFATIGVGALGALAGGLFADRLGRTTLTMLAMAVSGACALTIGLLYGGAPWLVGALCLLWGVAVVADSAQFSASIAELSNRFLVGTMLTLQTALGFTLTLSTIHLMPHFVEWFGWRYAFAPLAIGPFLGVWAIARLRAHPDSVKLAGGRR
jgi:MFS family permease